MRLLLLLGVFSVAPSNILPAQSPPPLTVIVEGVARSVPAASLRAIPRDTAHVTSTGDSTLTYVGVPLAAVLQSAGVRTDSLVGAALATRVVMESADGNKVVLALAELDQSLGGRRVLLADRVGGRPLPPNEGPWRLIVSGDLRPARSARQVLRIRVASEPR